MAILEKLQSIYHSLFQAHLQADGRPGHRRGAAASEQVCVAADVQSLRGGEEESGARPDCQAEEGHQGGER